MARWLRGSAGNGVFALLALIAAVAVSPLSKASAINGSLRGISWGGTDVLHRSPADRRR
jgi:hypothetical protein